MATDVTAHITASSDPKLDKGVYHSIFSTEYAKVKGDNDPLIKIPSDEFTVEQLPAENLLPKHIALSPKTELPHPASDVVSYLTSGRTIVKHKYSQHGMYPVKVQGSDFKPAETVIYEIDTHASKFNTKDGQQHKKSTLRDMFNNRDSKADLQGAAPPLIDETSLDKVNLDVNSKADMKIINQELKQEAVANGPRNTMEQLFNYKHEDQFDSRTGDLLIVKNASTRKTRSLEIQIIGMEWQSLPGCMLTGELFFIDSNSKNRLTESHKFDLTTSQSAPCNFKLTSPTAEVIMIVRIDKPYEGELSAWIDSYAKGKVSTSNAVSGYQQPFGWMSVHMFEDDSYSELSPGNSKEVITEQLYRFDEKISDEDLVQSILQMRAKANSKKPKQIPLKLKIKVSEQELEGKKTDYQYMEEFTSNTFNVSLQPRHHLYCWIKSLNITKGSSNWKNVSAKVQLVASDSLPGTQFDDQQVPSIFSAKGLKAEYSSLINYHNRQPSFCDEVKFALPLPLAKGHHLLFTFYHVSFTHKKEDTLIGYSFLPLLKNNLFVLDGEHELPLCLNLVENYLKDQNSDMKMYDSGKAALTIKLKLVSSFYTQDARLTWLFYTLIQKAELNEQDLDNSVKEMASVDPSFVATFWPTIVSYLINMLCTATSETMSKKAFKGFLTSIATVHGDSLKRHPVVLDFVKSHLQFKKEWKQPFHEVVAHQWNELLNSEVNSAQESMRYSWVFLESIAKLSLLQFEQKSKRTTGLQDRAKLFDTKFTQTLDSLVTAISSEVYRLAKSGLNIGKDVNESLASFCNKMLSCMPVDNVFGWIMQHVSGFNNELAVHVNLKFDFIKIVCAYEYGVALSLPPKLTGTEIQAQHHFYPYLVVLQTVHGLKQSSQESRVRGLSALKDLMVKYETDVRYKNAEDQKRIFTMFVPFVNAVCLMAERIVDRETARQFQPNERNLILLCFAMVLRFADRKYIFKLIEKDASTRSAICKCLSELVQAYKYIGKDKLVENFAMGINSPKPKTNENAMKYIENAYKASASGTSNLRELRGTLKQQLVNKGTVRNSILPTNSNRQSSMLETAESMMSTEGQNDVTVIAYQSHEIYTEVLSFLNDYCDVLRTMDAKGQLTTAIMDDFLNCLVVLSNAHQNLSSAKRLLKFIGRVFQNFYKFVLKGNQLCSEFCESLLTYLGYQDEGVRSLAAELIYVLMRFNLFETKSNISKVRVQLTVGLSKLDSGNASTLKLGLLLIQKFCNNDTNAPKALQKLVQDCISLLVNVLKDNLKLELNRDDPEMQEDMYFRLAHTYNGTPDLRLAMFESLADCHVQRNQFAEAALCKLTNAVMIAEYLKYRHIDIGAPSSFKGFQNASKNISEDTFFRADLNVDDEGICQGHMFSESGFTDLLNGSIAHFRKANLHETAVEVYKLLVPIYEKERSYEKLSKLYESVKECYDAIIATMGKRILATFFRVSYFGAQFGTLNGQSFIFKERSVTQLSEIVQRLTETYKMKYGANFELINDSAKLDKNKLDAKKLYLAVVHVEPYFEPTEQDRITYFDKMNNVSKFAFEMPYTLSGSARGEVDSQHMKKTILTTETSFPYVKKRLLIASVKEVDLNPLEVSLESLSEKVEKLRLTVELKPLNLKNLQLLLQGILRPQVNKGPLEIAQVFIENKENAKKYPAAMVTRLKEKFSQMIELCGRGVKLSTANSPEDQDDYNADLEEGYNILQVKFDAICGVKVATQAETATAPK